MKLKHIFPLAIASMALLLTAPACGGDEPDDPKENPVNPSNPTDPSRPGDDDPSQGGFEGTDSKYVTTVGFETTRACWVTLSGEVSAGGKEVEAGFELSTDKTFKEIRTVGTQQAAGSYEAEVKGILDQETYYYRSYAENNGVRYYGKTGSFSTQELTYEVGGVTFRMIKIEDGPNGPISMMQTELPMEEAITVAGKSHAMPYSAFGECTKGNMRDMIYSFLRAETGLCWRYPTVDEWKMAATGGNKSKGYRFSGGNTLDLVGWYSGNVTGKKVQTFALKEPNELGFYDMSGNYAELAATGLEEYLSDRNYDTAKLFDVEWSNSRAYGGSWSSSESECTSGSSVSVPTCKEQNQFDRRTISVRLVYTRDAYYNCWF